MKADGKYLFTTRAAVTTVITLDEFKEHIKWYADDTTMDTQMTWALEAAMAMSEGLTGLCLAAHTVELYTDAWPEDKEWELRYLPDLSEDEDVTIEYIPSTGGATRTALVQDTDFLRDDGSGIIVFPSLPSNPYSRSDAIRVEFTTKAYTGLHQNVLKEWIMIAAGEVWETPANMKDDLWKLSDRLLNQFRPLF